MTIDPSEYIHALMNMKVSDIAHTHVITVNEDDDLGEVCRVLSERKFKKDPAKNNGKMTGIRAISQNA